MKPYDIAELHEKYGIPILPSPRLPAVKRRRLRLSLLQEELSELGAALRRGDFQATLDALCDLQVVLDGSFLEFGMFDIKDAAMAEVHRSNMTKQGGEPSGGKIIKGPNFSPPDLRSLFVGLIKENDS